MRNIFSNVINTLKEKKMLRNFSWLKILETWKQNVKLEPRLDPIVEKNVLKDIDAIETSMIQLIQVICSCHIDWNWPH
jgi:hypothetical protein